MHKVKVRILSRRLDRVRLGPVPVDPAVTQVEDRGRSRRFGRQYIEVSRVPRQVVEGREIREGRSRGSKEGRYRRTRACRTKDVQKRLT